MLLQVTAPLFLVLLLIQAMVGYVELGTDSWIGKITGSILANANYGMLLFIYTSGLMFILRFFGGPIEHRLSPLGLLCTQRHLGRYRPDIAEPRRRQRSSAYSRSPCTA